MTIKAKFEQKDEVFESAGLEDGGHNILKCSNCMAPLVDLWVTKPDNNSSWNFRADCPHCGDHSDIVNVKGMLHTGSTDYTLFEEPEIIEKDIGGDLVTYIRLKTSKIKEWK